MTLSVMKGKRVLVTGGAGVIGRELLALLKARSADVLSVDRLPLLKKDQAGVRHVINNLDADPLDELSEFRPEIVFHLAAAFERSKETPEFAVANWRDNILVSHRLIEMTRNTPSIGTLVFASSYLVYSPDLYLSAKWREDPVSLKEDTRVGPRNLCGAAKYYIESEIDSLRSGLDSRLRTVHARIFRVYGRGSKDVISRWIRATSAGEPIEAYNTKNRFDFIFAGDVAEGLLRLAETPGAEGVVNLGSGITPTIADVLQQIRAFSDGSAKISEIASDEPLEASLAEVAHLKELTGWVPPIKLADGMNLVREYEKK